MMNCCGVRPAMGSLPQVNGKGMRTYDTPVTPRMPKNLSLARSGRLLLLKPRSSEPATDIDRYARPALANNRTENANCITTRAFAKRERPCVRCQRVSGRESGSPDLWSGLSGEGH